MNIFDATMLAEGVDAPESEEQLREAWQTPAGDAVTVKVRRPGANSTPDYIVIDTRIIDIRIHRPTKARNIIVVGSVVRAAGC